MAHTHDVYDMENHFEINGSSRFIKETSGTKLVVVQGDHKSEVLTFKMPRYIDGHDMTLCNKIRIHYINLDTKTNNKSADVYEVTDLTLCEECEDVLTFTWTIEAPATKYSGTLSFLVKFECTEGENVLYQWNTAKYVSVNVLAGIDNSEEFVDKYSNVLEEWYNELTKGADSIEELNQQAIAEIELAKEDAKEDIQGKADATMAEMSSYSANTYNSFKNDVDEKAAEALQSIPEDYTEMGNNIGLLKKQIQRLFRRTQINLLCEGNYQVIDGKWYGSQGKELDGGANYGTLSVNVYALSRVFLTHYHNTVTLWSKGSFVSCLFETGVEGKNVFIDIPNNVDEIRVTIHNKYLYSLIEQQVMVIETDTTPDGYVEPIDNFVEYVNALKKELRAGVCRVNSFLPFTFDTYNKANINVLDDGVSVEVNTDGSAYQGVNLFFTAVDELIHNELTVCFNLLNAKKYEYYLQCKDNSAWINVKKNVNFLSEDSAQLSVSKAFFIDNDILDKRLNLIIASGSAEQFTIADTKVFCDFESQNLYQDLAYFKKFAMETEEEVAKLEEKISSHPYKDKKILFMGDSITALNVGERGWCKYFNEIIKPSSFVNVAVSGARWCDYSDTVYDGNPLGTDDAKKNNTMGNQVEKILRGKDSTNPNYSHVAEYDDFDIIMIACGTNDGTPSGDIESSFTIDDSVVPLEQLDKTIFSSAFRYAIEKLQFLYPDAKIFICTPVQGWITTRSYSSTKAKGDYLKLLAGRMSLEVIDTFECGICGLYEVKNGNGRDLIDGLHPNVNGAIKIGKYNAKNVIAKYI